jgi:DNA-binding response OmpR family regulator
VRFMRHHAMPLPPELEGGPLPVVVATPEPLVAGRIAEALMGESVRVEHAASYFELGVLARQSPGVVVLDMALGRTEGLRVLEALPRVVVLADEDEPDLGGLRALAADVFQKPCDLALLAERLLSPAAE